MELADKVVLVTGGASGLGLATVKRMVSDGASAVIVDLPSSDGAAIADKLGANVKFVPADVRSEDEVASAVDVASELGALAVVVNCAGIGDARRIVNKKGPYPLADFRNIVEVNLIGTFNVVRLAAARFIETASTTEECGVIINTASVAAFDGQVGQLAYAASKSGIVGLTLPLARDLAQHRVRVMTIAPGLFKTPLFDTLSDDAISALGAQVPHPNRLGDPAEYADLVAHIVVNPMLNGETIRLDGGIRMSAK